MKKANTKLNPTKMLLISLIAVIIVGTIILKLPRCNKQEIGLVDTLFIATSAVCVTGLTTKIPAEQFSTFGQVVIMCLIQIGGIRIHDIYFTYINVYR